MTIAVISDIHANLPAFEAVVEDLGRLKPDKLVFLGDLVMTGSRPAEVYSLLESLKPDIWLQGNTDSWLAEIDEDWTAANERMQTVKEMTLWCAPKLSSSQKEHLASLPISQSLDCNGSLITFCHGSPSSFSAGILPSNTPAELDELTSGAPADSAFIVCGHTHHRFVIQHCELTILNFGAVSIPGEDYIKHACFGVIDIGEHISFHPKECSFNLETYCSELLEINYPGKALILEKYGL